MAQFKLDITQQMGEGAVKVIDLLIEKYDRLGMRATGRWADALEYEITENSVIIRGLDYSEYLAQGRRPGGDAPVRAIYEWMHNKPGFTGEKTLGRAIAISKTIGKQGTSWYLKGGSDLIDFLSDPEVVRTFFGAIQDIITVQIADELRQNFETLEA